MFGKSTKFLRFLAITLILAAAAPFYGFAYERAPQKPAIVLPLRFFPPSPLLAPQGNYGRPGGASRNSTGHFQGENAPEAVGVKRIKNGPALIRRIRATVF